MKLAHGTLIATGCTVGEGLTKPVRAVVRVEDRDIAVILKYIPPHSIAAECFCALLLRAWGVPVPEPILVETPTGPAFASMEVEYPSLHHRLGLNLNGLPDSVRTQLTHEGARIVCGWKATPLALAADEAISNYDRNLGNLLWDGGDPWFIDHDQSLGKSTQPNANKLAKLAQLIGEHSPIERAAVGVALTLSAHYAQEAEIESGIDATGFAAYVETRVPSLASKVLSRFPKPQDLLSNL